MRWWAVLTGAVAAIALLVVAVASAGVTITVATFADDSAGTAANCPGSGCSLRDAIAYANANAGTTIAIPPGVYRLTSGQLAITGSVTIAGRGTTAGDTQIDQTTAGQRVIEIDPSANVSVAISDVEITGGDITDPSYAAGGGIYAVPAASNTTIGLTLTGDLLDGNIAEGTSATTAGSGGASGVGGGLYAFGNSSAGQIVNLTVTGSTFIGNRAIGGNGAATSAASTAGGGGGQGAGAGISFQSAGTITVQSGSVIAENYATAGNGATGGTNGAGGSGGSAYGAGIDSGSGTGVQLTLTGSSVRHNVTTGGNGAAGHGSGAPGGAGTASGGGVEEFNGALVRGVEVDENQTFNGSWGAGTPPQSLAGGGGGLAVGAASVIDDTTVADNASTGQPSAPAVGAGIQGTATADVVNTTITGNQSLAVGAGAVGSGGGISMSLGSGTNLLSLSGDTIYANSATTGGANLFANGSATIGDTIIAGALGSSGVNCTIQGTFSEQATPAGNLEDDNGATCGFTTAKGDIVATNPGLGTRALNGAGPETLLPAVGSPVIGKGGACQDPSASPTGPLTSDERGDPRPSGGPCDIGAVQIQPPVATTAPALTPAQATAGQTLACTQGTWTGDGTLTEAYSWQRNGNAIAGQTGATYTTVSGDAGHMITCTVTATSTYGDTGSKASGAVPVVAPQLTPTQTVTVTVTVTAPASAPKLTHAGQAHAKWRRKGKAPVGTSFSFTLSEAAKVTFSFTGKVKGRKVTGSLTVNGVAGVNHVAFRGRLSNGKLLAPGTYTVAITATANGKTSAKVTLHFTIEP
jgi:CSLREA domain-containing protein